MVNVPSTSTVRVASRGSDLALTQTNQVAALLRAAVPDLQVDVAVFRTLGDRVLDRPLSRIGEQGLFTRELDDALLRRDADLAVHSLKDVPTRLPDGLVIAAVSERTDPRDVLIVRDGRLGGSLAGLPRGARVGTSALRRQVQLAAHRPDLEAVDLRGNLNTRFAKLDAGAADAILLAAAGVVRLGWAHRVAEFLPLETWLPAPGQGALAVIMRDEPSALRDAVAAAVHDPITAACTRAERALLAELQGGCQVPIAAFAEIQDDTLVLRALVGEPGGERVLRATASAPVEDARAAGVTAARELLAAGAADLIRRAHPLPPAPRLT